MSLTQQQLEERRAYIGGTDAAALAGVNPPRWAQPIDVWREKVEPAVARPPSGMMALGTLMEELVANLATEATGTRWRRPGAPARSKLYPWAGGHLDRTALYDETSYGAGLHRALLECKWSMDRDEWGPQGTLQVPVRYAVQVQHYLAVTGRPVAILAVLLGYADFRWYRLERNDDLIRWLMELEERFWRDHVLTRVPPEPDGSEGYARHLRALYPESDGQEAVATPEQQAMVEGLREARLAREAAAQLEARMAQQVQASMGTTERLIGPGWRVSWRQSAPRLSVEWEELATRLLEQAYPQAVPTGIDLPEQWPTTKKARAELVRRVARELGLAHEEPGTRPFRPEWDGEVEA